MRIGTLLALLLVLQSLAAGFAQPARAHAERDSAFALALDRADCAPERHKGDGAPTRGVDRHCCILCLLGCSGDTAPFGAVVAGRLAFPAPLRAVAVVGSLDNDLKRKTFGWASSWSSRAPPLFC